MISCSVGCFGIDAALALMACWLSASSSSSCSFYGGFFSKLIGPVHCCECCGSVVHSSSMRRDLLPSKGLMIVILDGSRLSTSGPSESSQMFLGPHGLSSKDVLLLYNSLMSCLLDLVVVCVGQILECLLMASVVVCHNVGGFEVDAPSFFSVTVFAFCSCIICLGVVALGMLPLDADAFGLNHVSLIRL